MCDPISLGLMAAGMTMSYIGNKQAENASRNAYLAEQGRQKELTRQQDDALGQSYDAVNKLKNPAAEAAAEDASRAKFINALNQAPVTQNYLPGQDSAPQVVADAAGRAGAEQHGRSIQTAGALAAMMGNQNMMQDANIAMGRSGQTIGQLGRDKVHSAEALDAELRAASYKGQTLRGLGGLFQTLGSAKAIGGMGGGAGTVAKMSKALYPAGGYGIPDFVKVVPFNPVLS